MANRLARETSPYLLQHAGNPVDWHPWDEDSLQLARDSGKPIHLSIGYSACHWCHVMAHESFEDAATAKIMNDLFVNIKVDREERPDLDRIYQIVHQLVTGQAGGWPLTSFLTPEQHLPIFAGTYFPRTAAYGRPAFADVLTRVHAYYRERADEVLANGRRLLDTLERLNAAPADGPSALTAEPIRAAQVRLAERFDAEHGGFGDAPKFPNASTLDFLLESRQVGDAGLAAAADPWRMYTRSLDGMAAGGLFDHLGGGFFRYCVDRSWTIPHFEKMLYDNAALLGTYADAFAASGRAQYANAANATADWLLEDMQAEDGGFFATLDADSEGHEGAFYVWQREAFDAVLAPPERDPAAAFFGLNQAPNFEGRAWHLQAGAALESLATERSETVEQTAALLRSAKDKLRAARAQRPRPGRDEKILTAWNGMAVEALAKAARHLGRPELADAAARAVDFVRAELWTDGRLKASHKDGRARLKAYLDDYAFLAAGLLELRHCLPRDRDIDFARQLADVMLERFADPQGGFFFTADDHETLIHRPKPLADEAVPSGNGVAALALQRLGELLGEARYLKAAEDTVRAALPWLARYPEAHPTLLRALQRQLR